MMLGARPPASSASLWRGATCLLLLAAASPAAGQSTDPKAAFVEGLARFSTALDGAYGDEPREIRAGLDAMARGLEVWDATVGASAAALAAELPHADPALAARLHLAVGAASLDRGRVQDALVEFDAASHLDPRRAEVFLFQGLAHAQLTGDLEGAIASFAQAAALDADNPIPVYLLGRVLGRAGRRAEARQAYQTVLHLWKQGPRGQPGAAPAAPFIRLDIVPERAGTEPFFPPVRYAEGYALLQQGRLEAALDAFRREVDRDPLVAGALDVSEPIERAAAAFREGDTATAARRLAVAIELAPDRADLHRLHARVLLESGGEEAAIGELQLAVRLDPQDERARLALADALIRLRRYPDAERALVETVERLPASGRAHYTLARVYQRENRSLEALAEFKAAAALHPLLGLNRVLQAIGAIEAAQQHFDAALDAYSRRVEIAPNDPEAHKALGYTYSRLDQADRDEALAEFAVWALLDPASADAYVAMSQVFLREADDEAAAELARQALARDPDNRQAHYALGAALMRLGRPGEAGPELEAFARLQREDLAARSRQMTVNGLRREAAIRLEHREFERAVALLREALALEPDRASVHLELGIVLLGWARPAEALKHLEEAARLEAPFEVHRHLAAAYAMLGRTAESDRERAVYERSRREALRRAAPER